MSSRASGKLGIRQKLALAKLRQSQSELGKHLRGLFSSGRLRAGEVATTASAAASHSSSSALADLRRMAKAKPTKKRVRGVRGKARPDTRNGKVARILREDGSQTSADIYQPGPNGFVIAKWVEEQEELELEVPNSCCKEGLLQIGMAAEKVMKKPAAMQAEAASSSHDPSGDVENKEKDQEAVKKGEEEEALEQEEEEQADENEVEGKQHEFEFKVVAGHGTEMTIVVKRTTKDKAQVLAIRGSTFAGTDWTPRTACQHIAGELQKEAAKVTSPVATCAFLPDLRKLAAAMKQGLCDNT